MHLSHICCGRGFILARNMDPRLQHSLQPILLQRQRIKWYIKWYEYLSLKMNFNQVKSHLILYFNISLQMWNSLGSLSNTINSTWYFSILNCKVYIVFNNIKSWTLRYTSIWICTGIRFKWMIVIDPWIIFNTEKLIKTICKTIRIIHLNKCIGTYPM
jgi:hypothetical protein